LRSHSFLDDESAKNRRLKIGTLAEEKRHRLGLVESGEADEFIRQRLFDEGRHYQSELLPFIRSASDCRKVDWWRCYNTPTDKKRRWRLIDYSQRRIRENYFCKALKKKRGQNRRRAFASPRTGWLS